MGSIDGYVFTTIGTEFCGAFGYADDIVLLTPSIHNMRQMLRICVTNLG